MIIKNDNMKAEEVNSYYHKDFLNFNGNRNRLNEIDLFWANKSHIYIPLLD